jgi:hypothetical protein
MTGVSKSQVSRLCGEIDERVGAFLTRPIEGDWPYVWIDATYVKVRQAGSIVSIALILAVGVNTDGVREILGLATGPSEAEPFWTEFLRGLARRGLRGVKLVISDARTSASRRRSRKCSKRRGSDAASTSCAMRSRTPAKGSFGALLLEQNDEWQLQRRYMKLEGLQVVSDNQTQRLSAVVTG